MGVINGNNNQVTVIVNDMVPPENIATIDKGTVIGNTYDKIRIDDKMDEVDQKLLDIQNLVESDFKGTVSPSTPAPTEDGSYKPEISSEDDKPTDPNSTVDWGTIYPNLGNLRAKSGYLTMFYKKGTAWSRSESKIPTETELFELAQGGTLPSQNLFNIVDPTIQNDTAIYDTTWVITTGLTGFKMSGWIPVSPNTQYTWLKYGLGGKNMQFTDASKVKVGGVKVGTTGNPNVRFSFTTPSNCYGIYYTCKSSSEGSIPPNMMLVQGTGLQSDGITELNFVPFGDVTYEGNEIIAVTGKVLVADRLSAGAQLDGKDIATIESVNQVLKNKKVAWYGTSIPAGYPNDGNKDVYSYANRAVINLGGTIQNYCVPNGTIRAKKANGSSMSGGRDALAFTNTSAVVNYQASMLNLIGTANEPNLWVFDFGVNDLQEDVSDFTTLPTTNSIDVNTFYGAYNFVLQKLFQSKPTARVLILSHFSNDSNTTTGYYKPVNDVVKVIADKWDIERLYVHEKSQFVNNGLVSVFGAGKQIPDGIHPGSDTTLGAVKILEKIVTEKMKSVYI
ncbi:SGNH/GDSL hydrolase family protein [Chryseobacterium sp. RP-3-3]|uniref:SGNH/GDSL hydrolase family protein n=1 Tax=Chryseobacterium antibioticum TaxID=2728847 RepID=A0A7Y0AMJ7_9FLAO|nr:SGNH/GDSL hydrolase family protein [Chryseobacterium antibioticum]NML70024.1 SGNH/GDSL hydrolase family protein [Chryseobacterium antibioticum]